MRVLVEGLDAVIEGEVIDGELLDGDGGRNCGRNTTPERLENGAPLTAFNVLSLRD